MAGKSGHPIDMKHVHTKRLMTKVADMKER